MKRVILLALITSTGLIASSYVTIENANVNGDTLTITENARLLGHGDVVTTHIDMSGLVTNQGTQNAVDISSNSFKIQNNEHQIGINAGQIGVNEANIQNNAHSIGTNTNAIHSNTNEIASNAHSIVVNGVNIANNEHQIQNLFSKYTDYTKRADQISEFHLDQSSNSLVLKEVSPDGKTINTFTIPLDTLKGEKGDKGDKGDTGAQGIKGDKGDRGEKGDKGDTGAAGKDGIDGTNGTDGVDGSDGADGKDGKDGRDGRDGKDGTNFNADEYEKKLAEYTARQNALIDYSLSAAAGAIATSSIDFGTVGEGQTEVGIGFGVSGGDFYTGTQVGYAGAAGMKHGITDEDAVIVKTWVGKHRAYGIGAGLTHRF